MSLPASPAPRRFPGIALPRLTSPPGVAGQRRLANLTVLHAGGLQFVVRCVLQREQGVVGFRRRPQDLVELSLGGRPVPGLRVLDNEDPSPLGSPAAVRRQAEGAAPGQDPQAGTEPPATSTVIPLIHEDRSEARNSAAWATSPGVPRRRTG